MKKNKVNNKRGQKPKAKARVRKKTKKRSKFPIGIFIYTLIISVSAWLGLNHLDQIEAYLSKVSVNFIGGVKAQNNQPEKKGPEQGVKKENSAVVPKSELTPISNVPKKKDINYFKMLEEKELVLQQREERLKKLESNLQQQREELLVKIKELEQLRADISLSLKDKVDTDKKTVEKLVQVYANMKPKSAAPVLEKMNEELAVKILHNMKKKNAAAILNVIDAERAKYLTEKIAGYQD